MRTVLRNFTLKGLDPDIDVAGLKALVHEKGQEAQVPIPSTKQRLVGMQLRSLGSRCSGCRWASPSLSLCTHVLQVYKGTVLTDGALKDAGVISGDHVVVLFNSQAAEPQIPMDTSPVRCLAPAVWAWLFCCNEQCNCWILMHRAVKTVCMSWTIKIVCMVCMDHHQSS